jgi:hypothetical protein
MRQEIKETFEVRSKEYITPHYWEFLTNLFEQYCEVASPVVPTNTFLTLTGYNRTTYYRFVKRFFISNKKFWDLMEEMRILHRKLEMDSASSERTKVSSSYGGVSSASIS